MKKHWHIHDSSSYHRSNTCASKLSSGTSLQQAETGCEIEAVVKFPQLWNSFRYRINSRTDTQDERSIDPTEELEETLDLDSSFLCLMLAVNRISGSVQRKEETVTVKHVLTHEKSLNKVSSFSPLFYQIFQVILWWKYLTS